MRSTRLPSSKGGIGALARDFAIYDVFTDAPLAGNPLAVVFDGDGLAESVHALSGRAGSQVIYTPRGVSADETLRRLAHEAEARGEQATMVSEDVEVRQGATDAGARAARPDEFANRLNQPARDVRKRGMHRAAMKSLLDGRDAETDERDSRRIGGKKGNPRRQARRRRGSSEPVV
jgi:predicted RNA-binding protein with PIN domain